MVGSIVHWQVRWRHAFCSRSTKKRLRKTKWYREAPNSNTCVTVPTNCLPFRQLPVILTTIAQRVTIFKCELWFNCSHKIVLYRGKWSGKLRYYYRVTNIIWDFQLSGSHPYINMIYNFNFHFFSERTAPWRREQLCLKRISC